MSKLLRILLVEDSEDDALLLLRELKRGGYEPRYERVETPDAMREALANREWDIVISDYVLPSFSGLAALEVLNESGLDLPFIIVSGNIGEDIAVGAMRAGAHDYIIKGNLARLVPAVERELRDAVVGLERLPPCRHADRGRGGKYSLRVLHRLRFHFFGVRADPLAHPRSVRLHQGRSR